MLINDIVQYLKKCDDAYYNSANPLLSDASYDNLVDAVRSAEPDNMYLQKVGAPIKGKASARNVPMGTLSKYHDESEVLKWLESEEAIDNTILVCPKYDGFAVELIYESGNLVGASTRGDGYVGENVLASIAQIPSIPQSIQEHKDIRVRGEVIIPVANHDEIKALGYTAMRNAVPGIVRAMHKNALKYVDYVAYEFFDEQETRISQREHYREDFIIEDFQVVPIKDIAQMQKIRESWRAKDYLYELDGIVLKSNIIQSDDLLHPNHMIAWKYKSNREATTLRGIEYQLGATGAFTPIAVFDPVEFQGATLTRASLGNMTRLYTEFKDISIGSIIEVSRRGDIIPYVETMIDINESEDPIPKLTVCPHCGSHLVPLDPSPLCMNPECPEILRLKISSYVRSLGIKGIGDAVVRGLIDAGVLKSIKDIYNVVPEDITNLPRQGMSMAIKWQTLQEKKLSAVELLTAYPFNNLGEKIWESLESAGYDYENILTIESPQLQAADIKGIGYNKVLAITSQIEEHYDELVWLGRQHQLLENEK